MITPLVNKQDLDTVAIYIHWPFCKAKCPYCDFNSYATEQYDLARFHHAYITALSESIEHTGKRMISSIYFGGGTPSMMPASLVEAVIKHIADLHQLSADTEITLEANPTSFEMQKFRDFRSAGVNRLSLGVQSLRDDILTFLGRWHNVADAIAAIEASQNIFECMSFDLIYAHPEQSLDAWKKELKQAIALAHGHLSLYQLTIEPTTVFGKQKIQPLEDNNAAIFYTETLKMMKQAGIEAYEISNFAKEGHESQHNLNYWNMGDWVGVGAGAHGRITKQNIRYATQDSRYPDGWLQAVEKHGHGRQSMRALNEYEIQTERILTKMRTKWGCSKQELAFIDSEKIYHLCKANYLYERPDGNIAATAQGWLLYDSVLEYLL